MPNTLFIGRKIIYLPSCHSTNDIAASLLKDKNVIEGTTVITDQQTAGRGQRGNTWEAEPGKNLTFSIVLKPSFLQASQQFSLNMVISLACLQFLSEYISEGIQIKWPNDLYYYDKKIGGILIESTIKNTMLDNIIAGIGLNINQEHFAEPRAISMTLINKQTYDLERLLTNLLTKIEHNYFKLKTGHLYYIQNNYLKNLYGYHKNRLFRTNIVFEGQIIGIDEIGRLGIETGGVVRYFFFKEVEFI
ncbi:biotin--[acetyl-CoA-carboxylase] ligase [Rhodocytophaga rosea]|uniref:biotin--[acetyl-CoA-carboxylase] ligase n=1 Tax=Rhodocytophaga rosea TaxID=2704465 RepID=UPI001E38F3F0|nr:biotin--[acetyl-CoA-carboxylase] ligase [Rhodocytophaga rosea]